MLHCKVPTPCSWKIFQNFPYYHEKALFCCNMHCLVNEINISENLLLALQNSIPWRSWNPVRSGWPLVSSLQMKIIQILTPKENVLLGKQHNSGLHLPKRLTKMIMDWSIVAKRKDQSVLNTYFKKKRWPRGNIREAYKSMNDVKKGLERNFSPCLVILELRVIQWNCLAVHSREAKECTSCTA